MSFYDIGLRILILRMIPESYACDAESAYFCFFFISKALLSHANNTDPAIQSQELTSQTS